MISLLSLSSWTFNANLNLELDHIWSSTTPVGFCVAKIKWTPNVRPIRATDTNSLINSGCSFFNSANSSEIMNKWGSGSFAFPFLNNLLYLLMLLTSWSLKIRCLLDNSAFIDSNALILSAPSRLVIVPRRWGSFLNRLAIPPPL